MLQSAVARLLHGIELEQRVEVHKLDARNIVNGLAVEHMGQVVIHRGKGMRVAISHRITQDGVVFTNEDKVHSPGVNTDRGDVKSTLAHHLQSLDHLQIKGIDIPVEVTACLYQVVGKARQLLLLQSSVHQCTQDGASAGGTQVNGKVVFLVLHILIMCSLFLYKNDEDARHASSPILEF